ncbi:hypothetical protein [Pinibacter soli]|uniref:DUF3592 domain-containing protein n=1 Tax=Pinibacter soli TaxID=3044211 RepID=A0ABT6R7H4_9BACT|nr:hypothetical protein [Pinibacter soli]MDI3318388.1 hypothetical protein [Pinibacter soli]
MEISSENSTDRMKVLWGFLIIITMLGLYKVYLNNRINTYGVYLKGTLVDVEGRKGGLNITIKYLFDGKEYNNTRGTSHLNSNDIGKQFFIKLVPDKPNQIVVLEENPVPDCLLNIDSPTGGWKTIPNCPN